VLAEKSSARKWEQELDSESGQASTEASGWPWATVLAEKSWMRQWEPAREQE
jgi:hypothetical protein